MSLGADKLSGDGDAAEYPCLKRFRYRRLITMLWLQGFEATAESMFDESDAMFSMLRLAQLIENNQWRDAVRYLSRFVPTPTPTNAHRPPLISVEAKVLRLFLGAHEVLAADKESPMYRQYLSHDRAVCHGLVRLRCILLNALYCRHQLSRASIDWESVRLKASEIARDLACRTPELQGVLFFPGGPLKPHNVQPIGFGFHRRYPLKKRATRLPRASALAKHYFKIRRSLPATSGPFQESCDELLIESKALDWVADILDECLKAGKLPESHQVLPLQKSGKGGATAAPVLHPVFSGLACPSTNHGMPSVGNEGSKSSSHVPTNGTPFLGTIQAPVSQTAIGSPSGFMANAVTNVGSKSSSHVPTNGTPFLGTIQAPVSQTAIGSPSGFMANAGAPATPDVSQSQTVNLRRFAEYIGKFRSHLPTHGAPFLGTMGAPVSQTAFSSLTSHCEKSGAALMAKSTGAPVAPVSQTMNVTSHSGHSGGVVAPVSHNMFGTYVRTLTGPAEVAEIVRCRPLVTNADKLSM